MTERRSTPAPSHNHTHGSGAGEVEVLAQPDVFIPAQAEVGEGPVIDQRTGRLCWVDITQGMVYEHQLADRSQVTSTSVDTMVGAIARRDRPEGFAVAVADGFGYWRRPADDRRSRPA